VCRYLVAHRVDVKAKIDSRLTTAPRSYADRAVCFQEFSRGWKDLLTDIGGEAVWAPLVGLDAVKKEIILAIFDLLSDRSRQSVEDWRKIPFTEDVL
jgi:hypothetical protein